MEKIPEFLPIATTIFSIFFANQILSHYKLRKSKYLLWWTIGVITFGLGTFSESINILFGWNSVNLKFWYIVGALLGGFPLAQGSVYLLMNKRFADTTTIIYVLLITIAAACVVLSPIVLPENFNYTLTGSVLEWKWVRNFSPFINIYAFIFLVGGAGYSAYLYFKKGKEARFKGNVYIALGGLLPGVGGTFARLGHVNVLFVTELAGLLLIYLGYVIIKRDKSVSAPVVHLKSVASKI
jgi:hypothetical protein